MDVNDDAFYLDARRAFRLFASERAVFQEGRNEKTRFRGFL